MRFVLVVCSLLLACGSKTDEKSPPPQQPHKPDPQQMAVQRTAVQKVGDVLPDLGAFPLPKELGEDPVFVLDDGIYDRDPEAKPVVALIDRKLPGADMVVPELRPLFERRARGQRERPFGVDLYVHQDTPFLTFARILATAQDVGFGRFYLGVRNNMGVRRLPFVLPEPGTDALDFVMSVSRDRLRVWSLSGEHGTAEAPALDLDASEYGALASGLDKLVPRDNSAPLTIRIDPEVRYRSVILVVVAVRPIAPQVILELATP